ncbi:MAG: glutathione peroxidase [Candidatus Methylomirabilis sp.]|nr:glutathione peroxidase [Deltaproteobacteria bacterium]
MSNFHDFTVKTIEGKPLPLSAFKGKAVLAVNVASQCGLTPQYKGLEALYEAQKDKGLVVLGLPCNQFAGQEPGAEAEIKTFCERNYGVTFPLASKIEVNGPGRHPLYQWLAGEGAKFPGDIQWNFEKFLIGKNGDVLARFAPQTGPEAPELKAAVDKALA